MIRNRREVGFTLCRVKNGRLTHGPMVQGTPTSVNIPVACPPGTRFEGLFHTHPGGIPQPSPTDIRSAVRIGAKILCVQSDNKLNCFRVRRRR